MICERYKLSKILAYLHIFQVLQFHMTRIFQILEEDQGKHS